MASNYHLTTALITISLFHISFTHNITYHNGTFFQPPVTVNLVWYGKFTPTQRTIIVDFLQSLKQSATPLPSVASWWNTIDNYHNGSSETVIGTQILDENYSLGMKLTDDHIQRLAINVSQPNSINIVLTAKEVQVGMYCLGTCAGHGKTATEPQVAYAWVRNSETQCPSECAWPFHEPFYPPRYPPLVAPNFDVGVDGMVRYLGAMLAGAVTNPFGQGFFEDRGIQLEPLEAGTRCYAIFGEILIDKTTGASYNVNGLNGRKYLVQAIWDPKNDVCSLSV